MRTTYDRECIIICWLVPFEEVGDIEYRTCEDFLLDEIEDDHESAHTSIAIEVRMDGFELIMSNGNFYKLRNMEIFIMEKLLEICEQFR